MTENEPKKIPDDARDEVEQLIRRLYDRLGLNPGQEINWAEFERLLFSPSPEVDARFDKKSDRDHPPLP